MGFRNDTALKKQWGGKNEEMVNLMIFIELRMLHY